MIPFFGHVGSIATIKPLDVDAFAAHLTPKVESASVNRCLTILKTMLKSAVRWGFLEKSPAEKAEKLREKPATIKTLTEEESRQLLMVTTGTHKGIYTCALYTGMRRGEIFALTWEQIDLEAGWITVDRSTEGTTKSGKIRYIPIAPELKIILQDQKKTGPLVFPSPHGTPYQRIKETFTRHLERAGIKKVIPFHGLRHTFATLFYKKTRDIIALKEILGHSDIKTTLIYATINKDTLKGHMERMRF